eukprot:RCo016447
MTSASAVPSPVPPSEDTGSPYHRAARQPSALPRPLFRENLARAQALRGQERSSYRTLPYGGFSYLPPAPSPHMNTFLLSAEWGDSAVQALRRVSGAPSWPSATSLFQDSLLTPSSWPSTAVGYSSAAGGQRASWTSSSGSLLRQPFPSHSGAAPSPGASGSHTPGPLSSTVPCGHYSAWRVLRSKRGYIHYLCEECRARWRTPTAKRQSQLQEILETV